MVGNNPADSGNSSQLSETYLRAKRYLMFFSGVLLLSVLAGIDPNTDETVLPVTITHPEYLNFVLAAVVLYYLGQLALFWDAQPQPAKTLRQHEIDYRLSIGIGFVAVATVMWMYGGPFVVAFSALVWSWLTGSNSPLLQFSWWELVLGLLGAMLPVVAVAVFQNVILIRLRHAKTDASHRAAVMANDLLLHKWELIYNPVTYEQTKKRSGSKPMSFDEGGVIGEGHNSNESRWQLAGEYLELLDGSGAVFSRFKYDPKKRRFDHTNDEDTKSIRDQYMIQAESVFEAA